MAKGDPRQADAKGSGYFPAIYQSAIAQSADDYDNIMDDYDALGDKVSSGPSEKLNYSPISPSLTEYQPGADYSRLEGFADTGGFSEGDIGNIRARAVAPIRSIYDSANRNLLRQKNLQGGYSPNFGAAQAKMARESSSLISDRTTNANADIAEMVQRGKLAGVTALAPLQAADVRRKQDVMDTNTNISNQAAIFNSNREMDTAKFNKDVGDDDFSKILETIRGKQSTYGTTPAVASTFGNQVLNAANTVGGFPPVTRGSMGSGGVNPMNVDLPTKRKMIGASY